MNFQIFERRSTELASAEIEELFEKREERLRLAAHCGHPAVRCIPELSKLSRFTTMEELSGVSIELQDVAMIGVMRLATVLLRDRGIATRGPRVLSLEEAVDWAVQCGATFEQLTWAIAEAAILHV